VGEVGESPSRQQAALFHGKGKPHLFALATVTIVAQIGVLVREVMNYSGAGAFYGHVQPYSTQGVESAAALLQMEDAARNRKQLSGDERKRQK
jgi:hypothetical protein